MDNTTKYNIVLNTATLLGNNMVLEIQSTDIFDIGNHKFYRPVKDLESIKANMPNVPNLHDTLIQISRVMFQDALHNQVGSGKISIVKFDLDNFLKVWGISTIASQVWYDEVLEFIKNNRSRTTKFEFELDIFKNKHIFRTLYGFDDGDLPVNCMQRILSPVSFRSITYMKYAVPNIFEKTKFDEGEYERAFSASPNSKKYDSAKLIEMVDDLFDNIMKSILPYYDKVDFLRFG